MLFRSVVGESCTIVSAGGTDTFGLYDSNDPVLGRVTEVQAGSYALMDTQYMAQGLGFHQAVVVIGTVVLDGERMSELVSDDELDAELARRALNPADPVAAVNRIPFSEPEHPYSAQIMYAETPPFPLDPAHPAAGNRWGYINMGFGVRKFPRVEDGAIFSDDELD